MNSNKGISPEQTHWDLVVKPQVSLFSINFKEVWNYRDLLLLLVKRDFVAQYKQTVLGPVWNLLQPILTTAMFLLIFGNIANIPTDGIKAIPFYMSGIAIWNYFQVCLIATGTTFTTNASIFGKVYFPRLIVPLSIILSNLIRFAIQFGLVLVVILYYYFKGGGMHFGLSWLLMFPALVMMAGIALGLGISVSALTTKYRDFAILMTFTIQLVMYATPIAYPLSFLLHSKYKLLMSLNPLSPVVELFRYALFGAGTFTAGSLCFSACFMIFTVFLGLLLFNRVERDFMDTV